MTTRNNNQKEDEMRLREFRLRVSQLVSHEFVKRGGLKAPSSVLAILAPMLLAMRNAPNHHVDPNILAELERMEPIYINDFTRLMRFFRAKDEPSSVMKVVGAAGRTKLPTDLLDTLRQVQEGFDRHPALTDMEVTIDGEKMVLNESIAHQLYENGEIMHRSPGKREKIHSY